MALSGTLETFTVPDVLQLLGSTGKSGLLTLGGDRGMGQVWLDGGRIVAAHSDGAPKTTIEGVVYELLRFESGSFEFDPGAVADDPAVEPVEVDDALAAAALLVEEWKAVEAVLPSLDTRVRLVGSITADARVSPPDWAIVARIGYGATPRDLSDALDLEDLEVCRRLCDLVRRELVEIGSAGPVANDLEARRVGPAFAAPSFASGLVGHAGDGEEIDISGSPEEEPPAEEVAVAQLESDEGEGEGAAPAARWADEPDDVEVDDITPAEFLSELASLSPKAAAAIEALEGKDAKRGAHEAADGRILSSLVPAEDEQSEAQSDDDPVVFSVEESDQEEAEESAAVEPAADASTNLLNRFLSTRQ